MGNNLWIQAPARVKAGSEVALPQWWKDNPNPVIQSLQITQSWGSNPASGVITYVSPGANEGTPPIPAGCIIKLITDYGHGFFGICKSDNVSYSSSGHNRTMEFEDLRALLDWDVIYCRFNRPTKRWVNGRRIKVYEHVLPTNWQANIVTYTATPYTPAGICYMILRPVWLAGGCPTVESPWWNSFNLNEHSPRFHVDQANEALPVLDLEFEGTKLSAALVTLANAQGLTFTHSPTLQHPYRLWFCRKGEGGIPTWNGDMLDVDNTGYPITVNGHGVFPESSDNRRIGTAVSGNPSRIRIVGDRNLYQIFNLPLAPDWNKNWNGLFDEQELIHQIFTYGSTTADIGSGQTKIAQGTPFNTIDPQTDNLIGYQLASAYAHTITVQQYDAFRYGISNQLPYPNGGFSDHRKFQGRSRQTMPAMLYVQQVLFRAFRPPAAIPIAGAGTHVPLESLHLVGQNLTQITHNPTTGIMFPYEVNSVSQQIDGNGYAVIQGYCVGQDAFATLTPETFQIQKWQDWQSVWQSVPFQIDDNGDGGFVIFEQPVIKINRLIKYVSGSKEASNDTEPTYVCFDANPEFEAPSVKASLTFEADRFTFLWPPSSAVQTRDAVEQVNGLHAELVYDWEAKKGFEIPFADGQYSGTKAHLVAISLLNRQFAVVSGGFERKLKPGDYATPLHPCYDRCTISISPSGQVETVDFTSERGTNAFIPERDFDRTRTMDNLLPGQAELRAQARKNLLVATALRGNRDFAQMLSKIFKGYAGDGDKNLNPPIRIKNGSGASPLEFGTPLWKKPIRGVAAAAQTNEYTLAELPSATSAETTQFVGATVREDENPGKPIRTQSTGIIYIRVKGIVRVGETVGLSPHNAYLEKTGTNVVGVAQRAITDTSTKVIPVSIKGGGASSNYNIRGEYGPGIQYQVNDIVTVGCSLDEDANKEKFRDGDMAGTFLCIKSTKSVMPYDDEDWQEYWQCIARGRWGTMSYPLGDGDSKVVINKDHSSDPDYTGLKDEDIHPDTEIDISLYHINEKEAKFRRYRYCDKNGKEWWVWLLGTELYDQEAPAQHTPPDGENV